MDWQRAAGASENAKHENGGLWGRARLSGTQQECLDNLKRDSRIKKQFK